MSAKVKREDDIRRAAEKAAHKVQADYAQVKTEIDLDTVEVGATQPHLGPGAELLPR
ncbi:MAG: hypothetical protein HYZ81_21805 [Nitrospinae bacterium]|nr:hypothetical protein [Nitrospinota bacterium]